MVKKEPRNYQNNVHFWLKKIYYFVANLPADTQPVDVESEGSIPGKIPPDKDDLEIRTDLARELGPYKPSVISKEEAREACEKLYEMFNMPLDSDVLEFIEGPRCPGGKPRTRT